MIVLNILIVASIFFGVIIFILRKLFFTDSASAVNRLYEERQRTEQKQKELDEQMQRCEEQSRKLIADSKAEAERLRNELLTKTENERKEILAKAKEQASELTQKAYNSADRLKQEVIKKIDIKAISFAETILEKALDASAIEKLNESLIEGFIKELPGTDVQHIKEMESCDIVSSCEISEKYVKEIKKILEEKLGHKVETKGVLDKSVIGGVLLKFGTLTLDGSFVSKLRETAEKIKKDKERE